MFGYIPQLFQFKHAIYVLYFLYSLYINKVGLGLAHNPLTLRNRARLIYPDMIVQ